MRIGGGLGLDIVVGEFDDERVEFPRPTTLPRIVGSGVGL